MKITPVIVVPVYKEFNSISNEELVSFNRLIEILPAYPIIFFAPNYIDYVAYKKYAHEKKTEISIELFDDNYFTGIEAYSKLMLSALFYQRFSKYSHMLIYQLDAFVFTDQLLYWCNKGYDYIGAPWIEDKSGKHITGQITGAGNGGFCLRNIATMIKILSSKKPFKKFKQLKNEYINISAFALWFRYPKIMYRALTGYKNTGAFYAERFFNSEDAFWCNVVPASKYSINLPSIDESIKFSFEVAPEQLYKMNDSQLPFGCHAWFKHQPEFWRKYINW